MDLSNSFTYVFFVGSVMFCNPNQNSQNIRINSGDLLDSSYSILHKIKQTEDDLDFDYVGNKYMNLQRKSPLVPPNKHLPKIVDTIPPETIEIIQRTRIFSL